MTEDSRPWSRERAAEEIAKIEDGRFTYLNEDKLVKIENETVKNIIWSLIKKHKNGRGLPVLINRNPTIAYGSIFQMHVVKMTSGYTMGTPLQVLKSLAADFDKQFCHTYWQQCVKNLLKCWK